VSRRELTPLEKESTPGERLMESIRGSKGRMSLRKTSGPKPRPSLQERLYPEKIQQQRQLEQRQQPEPTSSPRQRTLTIDRREMEAMLDFDDDQGELDEEEEDEEETDDNSDFSHDFQPKIRSCLRHTKSFNATSARRHSISFANWIKKEEEEEEDVEEEECDERVTFNEEYLSASPWQTLELSLQEFKHIRSVLSKAQLDALNLDKDLKRDAEKGKVCYLCLKSRFGLFNWSVKCQLCQQLVCSKCSQKVSQHLFVFVYNYILLFR